MNTLLFKKPLYDLIEEGKKTSTLRRFCRLEEHEQILLRSGRRFQQVIVNQIDKIYLHEINDEIVQKEGFNSKEELLKTLEEIYPGKKIDTLFFIQWTPLP